MPTDIPTDLDDEIAVLLRRAEQRYTTGRRRLVAALHNGEGPLTLGQIMAAEPTLPQSSVYRNLTILEEVGIVTRIVTNGDFARYELAENLTEHHHHLICTNCGDVADFSLSGRVESTLDRALAESARTAGFTPTAHRLDLLGTCADCG